MVKIEYSVARHKLPFVPYSLPESIQIGRLKLLLGEIIDFKFQRACAAEFIAMTFFVVICCGCAMVTLNLPNPNLMMVAASFGSLLASFLDCIIPVHHSLIARFLLYYSSFDDCDPRVYRFWYYVSCSICWTSVRRSHQLCRQLRSLHRRKSLFRQMCLLHILTDAWFYGWCYIFIDDIW